MHKTCPAHFKDEHCHICDMWLCWRWCLSSKGVVCIQDEGVRLRKVASATPSQPASSSAAQHSSSMTSSPLSVDASAFASQPPIAYLIAMLILGIIVGKFLL